MVREDSRHLLGGLDVELLASKLHAVWVVVELSGPDAQQHVVHLRVAPSRVVRVVGSNERYLCVFVELEEALVDTPLLGDAMILHLQKDRVEDLRILEDQLACLIHAAFEDACRYLGGEAAGEADNSLAVLPEYLHVHARLIVEAFEETTGGELHEVLV